MTSWVAAMPPASRVRRRRRVALHQGERDRSQLVVPGHGRHEPDRSPVVHHLGTTVRQDVPGPVEVEEDQPARRPTEVVHPGDGLLPAVAPLVQVHGGPQPVDLVDDRAVVGLEPEPRPPGRHPQRLGRPDPGEWPISHDRNEIRARDDQLTPAPRRPRVVHDRPVCGGVADEVGPRVAPGQRLPRGRLGRVRLTEHGVVAGDVGDLDAEHEPHRLQPGDERRSGTRLHGDPRRRAVVDEVQGVLDVALGREDERLDGRAGRQTRHGLRGHRVQPGQTVLTRDGDDRAVGQVDDGEALLEQPLLAHRVPVVGRDPGVDTLGGDRAGRGQQG